MPHEPVRTSLTTDELTRLLRSDAPSASETETNASGSPQEQQCEFFTDWQLPEPITTSNRRALNDRNLPPHSSQPQSLPSDRS
jgi:hypothetical protein